MRPWKSTVTPSLHAGHAIQPKYKDEALFLIKNYSTLLAALRDPQAHISLMEQRRRAENLPSLETTIRNILQGGARGEEQEEFLHVTAGGRYPK